MKNAHAIDEARLGIMLNELRLPTIKTLWPQFAEQADREGWPAARFLSAIAEHELAERANRRIERHLAEAHLPPGKTLDSFAFDAVAMISKAHVMAITAGDSWLAKGANILMFGLPRRRKEPSRRRYRPCADRERMAGPLHPDHRSCAEAPGRPPGTAARIRYRQTQQVRPAHPR